MLVDELNSLKIHFKNHTKNVNNSVIDKEWYLAAYDSLFTSVV